MPLCPCISKTPRTVQASLASHEENRVGCIKCNSKCSALAHAIVLFILGSGGIAGLVFIGLGAGNVFGPINSAGFIASMAAGGTLAVVGGVLSGICIAGGIISCICRIPTSAR